LIPAAAPSSISSDTTPSPSQRDAIEAEPRALLVLAGPGAGKTYCLTERIRFLIEHHHFDPARVCAFTFTNKAADEITHRLEARLGSTAAQVTSGTIHAFCAELLRSYGSQVRLDPGFGIADEEYQLRLLRRLDGPKRRQWHRGLLQRFSAHRLRGDALSHDNFVLFERYARFLERHNVVDFDMLIVKAAELLEHCDPEPMIRSRWDVILVDEFQDLSLMQYRVITGLARDHRHVFAVGDHEQSIYSWAGADPDIFKRLLNDFALSTALSISENRRCPSQVFSLARRLVSHNAPIFSTHVAQRAERQSAFPVEAIGFSNDDDEAAWLIADLRRDHARHGHRWGDVALLYTKHVIGDRLESALLNAEIPCRLVKGRALADDPVAAYVIAVAQLIVHPEDEMHQNAFFRIVLGGALYDQALAEAEKRQTRLSTELQRMGSQSPRADETGREIRRALANWRNIDALGKQHPTIASLLQDLLSRKVGPLESVLSENHDDISDPGTLPDVVALAEQLRDARARHSPVTIPRLGGADIALKGMLAEIGIRADGQRFSSDPSSVRLTAHDAPSVGLALGVFKAIQLISMTDAPGPLINFTAVDIETTDRDRRSAEVVEIAAVRVRDGQIVDRFVALVNPQTTISRQATAKHGITDAMVAEAPRFADVWPNFRDFCGDDLVVAHNGYDFDFPVVKRMTHDMGVQLDLYTYDSLPLARELIATSCKLEDLARHFCIPVEVAHRALADSETLAKVLLALGEAKSSRARKTALADMLGHLGVALALTPEEDLCEEARNFRQYARVSVLGRYSTCLDYYEREWVKRQDDALPKVDEIIDRFGGLTNLERIRADKTADERYPEAMTRLRRLIGGLPSGSLSEQLPRFLERAVLSKCGDEPDLNRVNLLTLHSTKGLEFSRVYIVGVEDAQMPGNRPNHPPGPEAVEEARRLLYVGMTRTIDRLVLTFTTSRGEESAGGHQFLDEMDLTPGVAL